jgi:hypothetical protein
VSAQTTLKIWRPLRFPIDLINELDLLMATIIEDLVPSAVSIEHCALPCPQKSFRSRPVATLFDLWPKGSCREKKYPRKSAG